MSRSLLAVKKFEKSETMLIVDVVPRENAYSYQYSDETSVRFSGNDYTSKEM